MAAPGPTGSIPPRTFDVHLASDIMADGLYGQLKPLGFHRDDFIGGTTGVVHPCHYSVHPRSHEEFVRLWQDCRSILAGSTQREFFGYAEAEVTPAQFRRRFEWRPFDPEVPLPFSKLEYDVCPPGAYKDLDVHVTADLASVDPRLQAVLERELSLHYVDIRRASGEVVRVYTFQPLGLKQAVQLHRALAHYLDQAGGIAGKMKLEATFGFARFPEMAPVCPVLTRMPATVRLPA